ncbi:MAG: DJ-1/PfpI family protein [Pseudomonadota bacterium]
MTHPADSHLVVILAFDEVTASDITGTADVFAMATRYFLGSATPGYRIVIASIGGQPIRTSSGICMATEPLSQIATERIGTLVVPGGGPPADPPIPADLVAWLAREGCQVPRICGICTGTFLLAEAGLLTNKRVTTHWQAARVMAERYPQGRIEADHIYSRDGELWTSAGFTAGLDLALAVLEEDHGYEIAMEAARSFVTFLKRPGHQSQFSAALSSQIAGDRGFSKLHAWLMEHLADELSVETLADCVGMAPRTFARRYTEQVGRTPAKTIEAFRIEAALRSLAEPTLSLKKIARDCGFGDEQNMRRSFVRVLGVGPDSYRHSEAVGAAAALN